MTKTRELTRLSIFIAIELIVGLVPFLGYIPVNPTMNLTIMHIPVIIAAIVLGTKKGALIGFFFGLTSLINATWLRPSPIESPIFSPFFADGVFKGGWQSLVICFVPRILVGVVAGLVFLLIVKLIKNRSVALPVALPVAGVLGSMTNTVLVLMGIYYFYGEPYSAAYEKTLEALWSIFMGIISVNGALEAVAAGIITTLVCLPLLHLKDRGKI